MMRLCLNYAVNSLQELRDSSFEIHVAVVKQTRKKRRRDILGE